MAQAVWGDTGAPLDRLEYIPRDESWLRYLPAGCTIISAAGHGASYWSQSGKIEVRLEDGNVGTYFIKLSKTDVGRLMVEGEFESMKLLHSVSPDIVPKPLGFGTYESKEDTHFFLCVFVDMYDEVPDVLDFCTRIADLHMRSQDLSPNGKFGYAVPTCNGTCQQYTKWTSSWEQFFIDSLKDQFAREEGVHGFSQEIADMLPSLYEKVCPRLLRPLETEGRVLRPTLCHGDLWEGNIAVQAETGFPCIFDSSALWAHNEYEMLHWRSARFRIGKAFVKEYFHHFPISAPEDDWDDRNLLYSLIAELHDSTLFPSTERFRLLLIASMKTLVEKFPDGYQGTARRKGDEDGAKDGEFQMDEVHSKYSQMTVEENVWDPNGDEKSTRSEGKVADVLDSRMEDAKDDDELEATTTTPKAED